MNPQEIANKWQMNRYRTPGQIGGMDNKEYFDQMTVDIQISNLEARIRERKDCIYLLESALMDNDPEEPNAFPADYITCMNDEIGNHQTFITELEKELNQLKTNTNPQS